jgi:Ni,Fe-hydrogenase I cytochrome b subunit
MNPIAFNLPHSSLIRIWHWLTFVVMAFSLFSVLMGNVIFKTRTISPVIQESLQHSGANVTEKQSRGVAHEIHDIVWTWHKIIGYGLGILLISRFFIEFTQSKNERIAARIQNAKQGIKDSSLDTNDLKHFIWVNRAYLLFFLLLAFMAISGLGMAYEDDVPWLDHIKRINHNLHGLGQYAIYAYLILHIGGTVISDMTKHKGIISGMINGNR